MRKLWEMAIIPSNMKYCMHDIKLGKTGLLLLGRTIININGKETGKIPERFMKNSVLCVIGSRIFGCWLFDGEKPHSPYIWDPTGMVPHRFAEWDPTGKLLRQFISPEYGSGGLLNRLLYNNNHWVYFRRQYSDIITIFDGVKRSLKLVKLPLTGDNCIPCIVQDRLFLIGETPHHYALYIFDLNNGKQIKELPIKSVSTCPCQLVANEHYVAWVRHKHNLKNNEPVYVEYLNIADGVIHSHHIENAYMQPLFSFEDLGNPCKIHLSITEKHLVILYITGESLVKKTINLANGHETSSNDRTVDVLSLNSIEFQDGILLLRNRQCLHIQDFTREIAEPIKETRV